MLSGKDPSMTSIKCKRVMRLTRAHTSGPGLWSRDQDWAAAAEMARKRIVEFPLTGNGNILFPWDHSPP